MNIGILKVGDHVIVQSYLEDSIHRESVASGQRGVVEEIDQDVRWVRLNFGCPRSELQKGFNLMRAAFG